MLAEIIPKLAEFEREDHEYYPRPSLSGPERCERQMVYWGLGFSGNPLPGRTIVLFDDSSWHAELTLDWLRKSVYRVHSTEMRIDCGEKYGICLQGSIDGIVTDILGKDYLLENKSINHFTFQRYWTGELPQDYMSQIALYFRGVQKINPDIHEGIILVKNKNTAQYLEFVMEYKTDDLLIKEMINSRNEKKVINTTINNITDLAFSKFARVKKAIKDKNLPKRPYESNSWQCEYCAYNKICWE